MAKKSPISEYLSKIGKKGGEAKVAKGLASLPPEKVEAIRKKALETRRKNSAARAKKKGGEK